MSRTAPPRLDRLTAVLAARSFREPDTGRGDEDDGELTRPLPVVAVVERPERPGHLSGLLRLLPAAWRSARVDPGRPGALAIVLVAAVAAIIAAVGVWTGRPQAAPVPGTPTVQVGELGSVASSAPPRAAAVASSSSASPGAGSTLVVSVSGRVVRPGLVRVPDGARVADVLTAVGGPLPGVDVGALNLARRVADGEQIAVGVPAAPDGGGAQAGLPAAGSAPATKVDLNAATVAQLDALPGVGPVTAAHIVDWRTHNGRFSRVEQLREIDGIGEHRFQQLRELVTVG